MFVKSRAEPECHQLLRFQILMSESPKHHYVVIGNHSERGLIGKIAYCMYQNMNGDWVALLWNKKVNQQDRMVIINKSSMKVFSCLAEASNYAAKFRAMR